MACVEWIVALLAIWIVKQLLKGTPKPLFGHYSQKGGFYLIKKLIIYVYLRWIKTRERLIPKCDFNATDAHRFGAVASEEELLLESPANLESDENSFDQIAISGYDRLGNYLITRLIRKPKRQAEVWVYLRLATGQEYQLPNHPNSQVYHTDGKTFSAGGLTFEVLEPLRRWRVLFNGILRKGIKNEWSEEVEEDTLHVKFNFIWSPFCAPFDGKDQVNARLLARSIATEKWTSEFFRDLDLSDLNFYDQWGHLQGTLEMAGQDEQILQLRGQKTRSSGIRNLELVHRYVNIAINCEDGAVVHLRADSKRKGLTNLLSGYVIYCDGAIERIKRCNLDLPHFAEEQNIPEKFCIHLKTSLRSYHLQINVKNDGFIVYQGDQWNLKVHVRLLDVSMNNLSASGVMELGYSHSGGCPVPVQAEVPFLRDTDIGIPDSSLLVVKLTNPECQSGALVGGKGMSLGLMKSLKDAKFVVPSGLCITVAAYWHHIKENRKLKDQIQHLQDVCWKIKDGDLQEECKKVVDVVSATQLSPVLKNAINTGLQKVFEHSLSSVKLAVRSSAIGEDSEETSAAGQNDTFLGVKPSDELWDAVAKCWASQFSHIAVQYKRQHGQLINAGMAVVLQEMIPAEAAGVLFTRHPVTGSSENIIITANYGLGESVVSASADPDTITLTRTWNDKLKISKKDLGKKASKIIMKDDGGTEEKPIQDADTALCCISDEVAIRLGKLGIYLENAFGNPRDIEWAVCKDQVYLLQSRAITSFALENDFQIMHELDTALCCDQEVSSKANVGEVFPGATTPLTLSFPPVVFNLLMEMMALGTGETIGIMEKIVGYSLLGREIIDEKLHKLLLHRYGAARALDKFVQMYPSIKQLLFNDTRLDDSKKLYENGFNIPFGKSESAVGMYQKITQQFNVYKLAAQLHIDVSSGSSIWTTIVYAILSANDKELEMRVISDSAVLMGSCTDVVSADVPSSIKKLAAAIASSSEAKKFAEMNTQEALEWLANSNEAPKEQFKQFLHNHGHRCFKEFELRSQPWGMDPSSIIPIFQNSLKSPSVQETKEELTPSEAMAKLETKLSYISKKILLAILPLVRRAVGLREQGKSNLIKVGNGFRQAYLQLARQMVNEGRIPDPDLIFFFTHYELGQILKTRSARLLSKAIRRRNMHPFLESLKFSDVITGNPTPPGDILITYSTDIGWSPYFPLLSGVVTEIGGLISHGAVVAREYGLPCLIGAQEATRLFHSGDEVLLDASKGVLELISKSPCENVMA